MIYKELGRLIDYDIPCIEFYNAEGELEYIATLDNFERRHRYSFTRRLRTFWNN